MRRVSSSSCPSSGAWQPRRLRSCSPIAAKSVEPRSGDSWQRSIGSESRPRSCSSHSVLPQVEQQVRGILDLPRPAGTAFVRAVARAHRWEPLLRGGDPARAHRRRGHLPLARGMAPQAARSVARPAQRRGRGPATQRAAESYGPRGVDPGFGRRAPVRLRPAPLPERARRSSPRRRYQGVDRGPAPDRGLRRSLRLPPCPHPSKPSMPA